MKRKGVVDERGGSVSGLAYTKEDGTRGVTVSAEERVVATVLVAVMVKLAVAVVGSSRRGVASCVVGVVGVAASKLTRRFLRALALSLALVAVATVTMGSETVARGRARAVAMLGCTAEANSKERASEGVIPVND